MSQYAIVDSTGLVVNVIAWDGVTPYNSPSGTTAVNMGASGATIGWTYANNVFTSPLSSTTPSAPPPPTPAQQAAAALNLGIQITSTSTPTLNGTYSLSAQSIANVNAVVTYILLNSTFPGGNPTMPWADTSGTIHLFPSITEFKAFATAFANLIAQIQVYADTNGTIGSIPSNQVTIA